MANAFPGYPPYLHRAGEILKAADLPTITQAKALRPLTKLANLVGQAGSYTHRDDLAKVPGILAEAAKERDILAVGALAAELIMSEAYAAHRVDGPAPILTPPGLIAPGDPSAQLDRALADVAQAREALGKSMDSEFEALASVAQLQGEIMTLKAEVERLQADGLAAAMKHAAEVEAYQSEAALVAELHDRQVADLQAALEASTTAGAIDAGLTPEEVAVLDSPQHYTTPRTPRRKRPATPSAN